MKTLTGKVVSTKMTKSAAVEVTHTWVHPKYKKIVKKSNKFIADNELGAIEGDLVELQEGRPMSKLKRYSIIKILNKTVESDKKTTKEN
jgi:small subunit ribosomal protein S17